MNVQETNLQRHAREMREAGERLSADQAKDPQQRAMAEAIRLTADERAALAGAQAAVDEAEAAVNAAGVTLDRARRGQAPSYDRSEPFSFFKKSREAHRAVADAAVPGLAIDLEEARSRLQQAIRRRNDTARRIELARMERRRLAKLAHTPPRPRAELVGNRFAPKDAAR